MSVGQSTNQTLLLSTSRSGTRADGNSDSTEGKIISESSNQNAIPKNADKSSNDQKKEKFNDVFNHVKSHDTDNQMRNKSDITKSINEETKYEKNKEFDLKKYPDSESNAHNNHFYDSNKGYKNSGFLSKIQSDKKGDQTFSDEKIGFFSDFFSGASLTDGLSSRIKNLNRSTSNDDTFLSKEGANTTLGNVPTEGVLSEKKENNKGSEFSFSFDVNRLSLAKTNSSLENDELQSKSLLYRQQTENSLNLTSTVETNIGSGTGNGLPMEVQDLAAQEYGGTLDKIERGKEQLLENERAILQSEERSEGRSEETSKIEQIAKAEFKPSAQQVSPVDGNLKDIDSHDLFVAKKPTESGQLVEASKENSGAEQKGKIFQQEMIQNKLFKNELSESQNQSLQSENAKSIAGFNSTAAGSAESKMFQDKNVQERALHGSQKHEIPLNENILSDSINKKILEGDRKEFSSKELSSELNAANTVRNRGFDTQELDYRDLKGRDLDYRLSELKSRELNTAAAKHADLGGMSQDVVESMIDEAIDHKLEQKIDQQIKTHQSAVAQQELLQRGTISKNMLSPPPQLPNMLTHSQWSNAVADKVLWLAAQNMQSAEVQLDPPELGQLQIKIHINQEAASVNFVSAHASVRDALDATTSRLRDMFQQEGLDLVDVGVSDQSNQQRSFSEGNESGESQDNDGSSQSLEDGLSSEGAVIHATELKDITLRNRVDFYA